MCVFCLFYGTKILKKCVYSVASVFIKFKYMENADNFISCLKPYPKVGVIRMSGRGKNKQILQTLKK